MHSMNSVIHVGHLPRIPRAAGVACPPCPPCLRPQPFSGCFHPGREIARFNVTWKKISAQVAAFLSSFLYSWNSSWSVLNVLSIQFDMAILPYSAHYPSLLYPSISKLSAGVFHPWAVSPSRHQPAKICETSGNCFMETIGTGYRYESKPWYLHGNFGCNNPQGCLSPTYGKSYLLTRSIHFQVLPLFRQKITRVFLFTLQQVYVIWKTHHFYTDALDSHRFPYLTLLRLLSRNPPKTKLWFCPTSRSIAGSSSSNSCPHSPLEYFFKSP